MAGKNKLGNGIWFRRKVELPMNVGKGKIVRMIQKGRWSVKREMSHLILSELDRPSCNESPGEWRVDGSEVSNNCLQTVHSISDSVQRDSADFGALHYGQLRRNSKWVM